MKYLRIDEFDVANGPGVRIVLWLSGCSHKCQGCHNPESWNKDVGLTYTEVEEKYINNLLDNPYVKGLTLSGGDPLEPWNSDIEKSLRLFKSNHPDKTVWVYTGYLWEQIKNKEIMKYIDVLVDGPFEIDKRDITLKFRGSSNQRLINVPLSLAKQEVVLWEE